MPQPRLYSVELGRQLNVPVIIYAVENIERLDFLPKASVHFAGKSRSQKEAFEINTKAVAKIGTRLMQLVSRQ